MAAVAETREIARPLKMLETLIKEKFKKADEAAEEARKPFYEEIAPLLVEAREGYFQSASEFYVWATNKFGKSRTQIGTYVAYASREGHKPFKNLEETKYTKKEHGGMGWRPSPSRIARGWAPAVDDIAERARRESMRLAQEDALTRAQEREAERKLALRLIDIGYRVLAKELHPDKLHGDRDAFQRLGRVRDRLRHSI